MKIYGSISKLLSYKEAHPYDYKILEAILT